MWLICAIVFVLSLVQAQRPCVQKRYPGARTNIVCVCNSTYCDDFPPLGNLGINNVAVYLSSEDGYRFNKTVIQFSTKKNVKEAITVKIDASQQFQQILGFGGAFTDAVGINLNKISQNTKDSILKQYFSKNDGIGYTIGRVPMASCDFSTHPYSYADVENDFALEHFNLTNEDFTLKIPHILRAMNLTDPAEKLKLFSTPWSAPGWMKTNNQMKGGGELKGSVNGKYYQTWAKYFIRFFEEYAKQGIRFWGTSIQNEPSSGLLPDYGWQTMSMTAAVEAQFLSQLLGPTLKSNNASKDLKIMIFSDQRTDIKDYTTSVLMNPDAAKFVDGIAYHWYEDFLADAKVLSEVHNAFPDVFMLPTEACTGYLPVFRGVRFGDWSRASQYAHSIIEDTLNYAAGWVDWNFCLNENGGPNWVGNLCDSPVIVSNSSDVFYKQPMFYALGHFSKFVRPGSYRIKVTNPGEKLFESVAFTTPSNQRILVLNNRYDEAQTVNVEDANRPTQSVTLNLPGNSIMTLVWNKI